MSEPETETCWTAIVESLARCKHDGRLAVVIGSRAAALALADRNQSMWRAEADWDVVVQSWQLLRFLDAHGEAGLDDLKLYRPYPVGPLKLACRVAPYGTAFEFEIHEPAPAGQWSSSDALMCLFSKVAASSSGDGGSESVDSPSLPHLPGGGFCAAPWALHALKCAHVHWRVHWIKTVEDIHQFRRAFSPKELLAPSPSVLGQLLQLRRDETEARMGPSSRADLDATNEDFFARSAKRVARRFPHDAVHERAAYRARPAFEYLKSDQGRAALDPKLWAEAPDDLKLDAVREEVLVILLERFLIPSDLDPEDIDDMQPSHVRALSLVCTSLTKGKFRDFAVDHYPELKWMDGRARQLYVDWFGPTGAFPREAPTRAAAANPLPRALSDYDRFFNIETAVFDHLRTWPDDLLDLICEYCEEEVIDPVESEAETPDKSSSSSSSSHEEEEQEDEEEEDQKTQETDAEDATP